MANPQAQAQAEATELDDLEIREQLAKIERKPPMYRVFRVTLYTLYLVVASWLVISIAVAAWQSVYGRAGQQLKARAGQQAPLNAAPRTQR